MIIVEIVVSMQFVVCLMISYEFCFLNFYIDFVFCMVDLTICMANLISIYHLDIDHYCSCYF